MKGCRTVSVVVEDAHAPAMHASTSSTPSAASGSRYSLQEGSSGQWAGGARERKRASSLESWLHHALGSKSDADKEARRAARRAKRKAFFRKLFFMPPSLEVDEEEEKKEAEPADDDADAAQRHRTPPPASSKAGTASRDEVPEDAALIYKLDDGYYASMASILSQYKSDCMSDNGDDGADDDGESETEKEDCFDTSDLDSNTDMSEVSDMSEISVFDLEEEETDDEADELDTDVVTHADFSLVPIPETDLVEATVALAMAASPVVVRDVVREMPVHVAPPVRVPMEYTLQDRRGGTLVGGRHVLFTGAAFKRKQRQMLYGMRPVPEGAQYVEPQVRDDDDSDDDGDGELNTSGVYALQSEWI